MTDDAMKITKGDAVPQKFKEWFVNDRNHSETWREEAQEDYNFVAGRQWSDEEITELKKKARPVVVFNRVGPVVDSVHGHEIGNRREVRFIPREMGDAKANELLTAAAEWFRDLSHADDHESDAFLDSIICGMGWTETRIEFDDDPDGLPVVARIDPMEMFWDFDAKARNLSDARRVWRVRRMPLSEAQNMFPERSRAELDAGWTTVRSLDDLKKQNDNEADDDSGDGMVTIVHAQWIERESYYVAEDPTTGQLAEFTVEEFNVANKRLKKMAGMEMQGFKRRRKVRKQAFLGDVVLSYGDAPCPDGFSFQCITAKRDRNTGTWFGIVRGMKDPQRWANKWLSQMMHIMNSNSKGGLLAERGAFENQSQAEASWSDPSAITWLEDGALSANKVKEKPAAQFPAGFQQLTEFAVSSIRDVSGVSVEMLGMREANQAASLEYQRRQAGLTILQPIFDGLKHYRELQGRVLLHYIKNLADGRLVRIVGDGNAQYVPLVMEADAQFDIIVDDAPQSPNQKEAAWGFLQQILPMLADMVPPQMLLKLMEYSPLPQSLIEELQQAAQQPDEGAEKQQELAVREKEAEIRKTETEATENLANAAHNEAQAQLERARLGVEVVEKLATAANPQPEGPYQA